MIKTVIHRDEGDLMLYSGSIRREETEDGSIYKVGYQISDGAYFLDNSDTEPSLTFEDTESGEKYTIENIDWEERTYSDEDEIVDPAIVITTPPVGPVPFIEDKLDARGTFTLLDQPSTASAEA